jgi:hypothetical protein
MFTDLSSTSSTAYLFSWIQDCYAWKQDTILLPRIFHRYDNPKNSKRHRGRWSIRKSRLSSTRYAHRLNTLQRMWNILKIKPTTYNYICGIIEKTSRTTKKRMRPTKRLDESKVKIEYDKFSYYYHPPFIEIKILVNFPRFYIAIT